MPLKSNPKGEVVVTSELWNCNLDTSDHYKTKPVLFIEQRWMGWGRVGCKCMGRKGEQDSSVAKIRPIVWRIHEKSGKLLPFIKLLSKLPLIISPLCFGKWYSGKTACQNKTQMFAREVCQCFHTVNVKTVRFMLSALAPKNQILRHCTASPGSERKVVNQPQSHHQKNNKQNPLIYDMTEWSLS